MPKSASDNDRSKPEYSESELFTERNQYFTGKYMTARDFRDEQKYFLSHQRWHQWALHGWGIVWGLQVKVVNKHCLRIEPGMAIDCHGRELVLPYAVQFAISDLPETKEMYGQKDGILIGLQFHTIQRDLVPLLLDDRSECSEPAKNTHNRIQEWAKICAQKYCQECWTFPPVYFPAELPQPVSRHPYDDAKDGDDCNTLSLKEHNERDECGCTPPIRMKPTCECGERGFVPLAQLREVDGAWQTDDLGCRYVQSPFYAEALTHIIGINWDHGGKTCFQKLLNDFKIPVDSPDVKKYAEETLGKCQNYMGRIIIEFDRPLGLQVIERQGSAALSTYFGQLLRLEYVELDDRHGDHDVDGDDPAKPLSPKHFHLSQCRRKLYCDFPAHRVNHDLPVRMRLALNCDMILDERGRAVDGDHIGGQVPNLYERVEHKDRRYGRSGDGLEGGVFYSWTELTPSPK